MPLFADDTLASFFRRPCFSPDGALLLTPTGVVRVAGPPGGPAAVVVPTTFVFDRSRPQQPIAHYPGTTRSKPSVVVRACPVVFRHRTGASQLVAAVVSASASGAQLEGSSTAQSLDGAASAAAVASSSSSAAAPETPTKPATSTHNGVFSLPYRVIIAVATLDSVLIYDTSQVRLKKALVFVCVCCLHLLFDFALKCSHCPLLSLAGSTAKRSPISRGPPTEAFSSCARWTATSLQHPSTPGSSASHFLPATGA
jgi:hypothetical protein